MITVEQAKQIIKEHSTFFRIRKMDLIDAMGKVLADDVLSPIATPPFDQSAMDGYAFSFQKWDKKSNLRIVGEVQAGANYKAPLQPNEAVRIFTGAAVPETCDTVIAQEKVQLKNNFFQVLEDDITLGRNVRLQASQSQANQIILKKGHLLTPPSISLLANVGIDEVWVYDCPTIGIIVTGKELVQPGEILSKGQIFESNSFALQAVLKQLHLTPSFIQWVDDDLQATEQAVKKGLQCDILLITGGVSVGDYDFVAQALQNCGVQKLFHKIKQKPGKPLFFGQHDKGLVFALPGNPAAVLTCFYEYVAEAIGIFTRKIYFDKIEIILGNSYSKKEGLTHFVKGKTENGKVFILDGQESYLVNSFSIADCLVELPEHETHFEAGRVVKVLKI